ncbi:hypothetical protein LY28_01890 [Ruminiclostridium sufflavum DSM 19573]|uniref:Uncharacterized protein n=1 Tax=Ruminiclostridium sufflavum DSM 19573 TaxID=1121337 RepID=A0A318XNE6_9FIRM|nr:hypothetical protein [Ruminiclostridium sufflavum]PYG87522.1 hypothetical protein LY28_01890 [Ruminiclostridium sufflavum DSM 19573]
MFRKRRKIFKKSKSHKKSKSSHVRKNELKEITEKVKILEQIVADNSVKLYKPVLSSDTFDKVIVAESRNYIAKVRNQVKEVLQEQYDESFVHFFDKFENDSIFNRDNFILRLIFLILKKYGFIDIIDENGELDQNAIDSLLKSIAKDQDEIIAEIIINKADAEDAAGNEENTWEEKDSSSEYADAGNA